MSQLTAARIKRWSLLLAAYDYTIDFISGKDNVYADFLSRKPMNTQPSAEEQVTVNVMFIEGDQWLPWKLIKQDPVLSSILRRVGQITPNQYLKLMWECIFHSRTWVPGPIRPHMRIHDIVYGVFILISLHFYIGTSCHRLVILIQSFTWRVILLVI